MVQLRGQEIERFLKRPDPARSVVLFFGPDSGGVSERANDLAALLAGNDPHALSRFDEAELAGEPGRLAEEVFAPTLFSDRKIIRIRAGGNRSIAPALKGVLNQPPADNWVVIEAGDLRKTSPLRRLCESSGSAVAIGCYPDNDASLGRLIDSRVDAAALTIEPDARAALLNLLGADRAASRAEIEKLCLYAAGTGTIDLADVIATIGDGAAFAIDDVIDAAISGETDSVDRGLGRLRVGGTSASSIGVAAERRLFQMHRLRVEVEAGGSLADALRSVRPPLFPSRRPVVERQLRLWSAEALAGALHRLDRAMVDTRLRPAIASEVMSRWLISLAGQARRRARASA